MALSMKVINMDYLNHKSTVIPTFGNITNENLESGEFVISEDDPEKNVNNLRVKTVNDGDSDFIQISWNDCSDPDWKNNIIVKGENYIPTSPYDGNIFATSSIKNQYSINTLDDLDIRENILYCYRIFSELSNESKHYSGFKNIFFVYVNGTYDGGTF